MSAFRLRAETPFCSEPSSSFWRLRCRGELRLRFKKPTMVHHDGFQQRASKKIMDSFFLQIAEGTVEVIAVGASRTHSVVQRRRRFRSEPSSFMEGFNRMRLLVRSEHRSTSGLEHPRWRRRASMLTRGAVSQELSADARQDRRGYR